MNKGLNTMNLFKGFSRVAVALMVVVVSVWTVGCAETKTGDKTKTGKTEAKTGEAPEAGSSKTDGDTKLPSEN